MINQKELIKRIKKSKGHLIWSVHDNVHYITDRYWAVRFEKLPDPVLATLFSIFVGIPANNSSYRTQGNIVLKPDNLVDIRRIMEQPRNTKPGLVTNLLIQQESGLLRVIESSGEYIYLKEEHYKIVDDKEPACTDRINPVLFCDGNVLISPVRVEKVTYKHVIQDLLSLDG